MDGDDDELSAAFFAGDNSAVERWHPAIDGWAIDEQTLAEREAAGEDMPDDHVVNVSLTVSEIAKLTWAINRTGWADVSNA